MADWIFNTFGMHFIRPWAWLLLIPMLILFIWQGKSKFYQSNWSNLIDAHLLNWIMPHSENKTKTSIRNVLLLLFWVLAIMALSGPSWQQLPQPIYSSNDANVIVLDLSSSMDSDDIKPSRLKRAKYKISDLLENIHEGNTALTVYAGDAFILSPLTSDEKTIANLVNPLITELMPIKGSHPQLGIEKAIELLKNADQVSGNIIWITDGAEQKQLEVIKSLILETNYQLKILAVGTSEGAPIRMSGGRFLKDSNGNIVVPKLNYSELATFSNSIGASLTAITANNDDIDLLSRKTSNPLQDNFQKEDIFADSWHDSGYWILLLLIPIALYSFKNKNIIAALLITSVFYIAPSAPLKASISDKIFLNKDQQAKKLFSNGQIEEAELLFKDKNWKAIAAYKNGNYDNAIVNLSEATTADQQYNLGNSLALAEQYKAAISAYQKAIDLEANHEDAIYNKKVIEDLLEQKEQEKQNSDENSDEQNEQEQDQQDKEQEQQDQQQEQQNSDQEQQEKEQKEQTEEQKLQEMTEQEKEQELEQWLKRISDDPGRLIRNKMKLEYNRRGYRSKPTKTW